jgi:hypothetical protein
MFKYPLDSVETGVQDRKSVIFLLFFQLIPEIFTKKNLANFLLIYG